mgnify:FL=1
MNKNDKIEVLKFLTEQIRKNLIDDATYKDLIQDLKDLGITQEEIDKAIANNGKVTKAVKQSANDVKKLSNSSQKIVEQSTETINAVSKLQTEVSKSLTNINKNINIANKKVKQQSAKFSGLGGAGVKLMPGVEHEYVHTATKGDAKSQAAKAKLDKQIDKQHRLSVTKIAGILTQSDVDVLQKQLDAMQGQELTKEYADLKNKLNKAKEVHTGSVVSAKRGTAFHKIAELLEKGEFSIEQLTDQKIAELGEKYDEIKQGILAGGSQKDSISRLKKMTQDYEKFKTQNKLSGSVTTEKSVGFLTKIGEEWVEVVGTLDSFFNEINTLTDFKTGQAVDPKKIGIQLNLLKKALELQGIDTKDMKVFHLPFKSYREGGVYNVKGVDENTLYQWVSDAFNMFWGKQLKPTEDVKTLMESQLEPYEFTISKGEEKGQKRRSWKLNKRTLSSLEKDYAKGYLSADDVISMVQGLNPEDYEHFMNLLWSTKEYGAGKPASGIESDRLYRQGALWKELRARIPSFYTGIGTSSGISEKTFIDEEGNLAAATTVGGGFLSQWSKAYRLKLAQSGEQAAQEIIDQFVKIVKESTDEIGQEETFGRLSALSLKDSINDIFIDAVGKTLFGDSYEGFGINDIGINERSKDENAAIAIRNQKKAGERFYNEQGKFIRRLRGFEEFDVSGLEPEKVISFVKGIGSLKNIFKGALNEIGGTEMSQLNEAGLPEFIENSEYLLDRWDQFVSIIKNKVEPIVKNMKVAARQTGDWKSVNSIQNALNNLYLTEDISMLTTKTAHRFSWLYQAKDLYDKMLETELPKGMTTEEYARQRLTPKQYEQYIGSLELRHIAERSGGSLDELINNFLKAPVELLSSDLSKNIQDSLFKIKESSPELLKTTFYDIISKQTTLTGGESQKLNWWESVGAVERLRRGEEIKAWDPKSFEEVNTSDILISYLDEQIRDAIDSVSKGGAQATAEASRNLRKYLEELGVEGGPLNRLMRGDTAGLLEKYGITQDTESGKKYAELLERAKGVYSDKTAWTRESIIETFKDMPEKLSAVLQLVDVLEHVKSLPPAIFGEKKDEQKVAETKVDSDQTEVVADTIVIGEPEKIAEKAKTTKRRGRPKKKKVEKVAVTAPIEDVVSEVFSSDGGTGGGDGGDKTSPKSSGRKGKSDEEKAQADTEKRQKQDIREYQQYINKVISLESQIDKLQRQATLSGGKHKDAIYGTIDALNEELGDLNRNNDALVKRVAAEQSATKASIDATAELKKQSNAQKNLVSVKGATSIWDMMANDIRRATMRIADFGIAAKVLNKIPQDIQKVIQYTKELDAAMTNIRVVTGASAEEAQTLAQGYTKLAKELGITTVEVANSANEWARQGYEAEQANQLIVASSKLAKLGMISTTEATKDLTSAIKGFKLSTEDAMSVVDKLTKIDQVAAISAGNLAEGLARVSTTAQQAGLSLDETAAMVTTITEVTQRDASTAGEALRTLISRYSNVKAGVFTSMGEEAEETSGNINDIEKVLGKLGIRIRTSGTEMRSIEDVLDELAEKWDTLDDVSRNAVASAFAGVRQRESFNILLSNWNRVKELTEESANAAGTADEKYSAYMDSMEAATKRLQNAWEGFTQSLETSTVMKRMTNAAAFLVENADKLKYLVTVIAAASSVKLFDFFTNKGETGGFKGLIANIPFIGTGTKTNNILESIDKKVGVIQGEVTKDSTTKNGGLFSRIRTGFYEYGKMKRAAKGNVDVGEVYDLADTMALNAGFNPDLMSDAEYKKYLQLATTNKQKEAQDYLKKSREQRSTAFKQTAIVSGITTAVTQAMTTKQVSGYGQTVEETSGDKALRTGAATAGSIAGAATAFIPVIGPMIAPIAASLGSVAGEGLAGLISRWAHKDELQMKQRVQDAKENLSALNELDSKISTIAQNIEDQTSFADAIRDYFFKYPNLSDAFLDAFGGEFKNIPDLISQILKGDEKFNAQAVKYFQRTTAKEKIRETIASQEEQRYLNAAAFANVRIEGNANLSNEEKLEYVRKIVNKYKETNDTQKAAVWEEVASKLETALLSESKLDAEALKQYAEFGFVASGMGDLSPYELEKLGYEGAIKKIAEVIQKETGISALTNGKVNTDIYGQIASVINENPTLKSNLQYGTKNIGQLIKEGNVNRIKQFANAFGVTYEEALKLGNQFNELTVAMGMMTPSEVLSYYETLDNIFSDLAGNANLSQENIQKIFSDSNYADLIPYATQGSDALLSALYSRLLGGEKDRVYANALWASIIGNTDLFSKFSESLSEDQKKFLSAAGIKTFQALADEIAAGTIKDTKLIQKANESVSQWNIEYKKDLEGTNKLIQYQTSELEKQISNLQEQKDALSTINDERKKELEYIKARNALETAKKTKKRVYRSGVGWTFEVDEEAISTAVENLESLNVERRQNELQLQINQLEAYKSILQSLPNQEEQEQLRKLWEQMAGDDKTAGSFASVASATEALVKKYKNATEKLDTYTLWLKAQQKGENIPDGSVKGEGKTKIPTNIKSEKKATGVTSFAGGNVLLNELGTEAVITPGGTLTALPSKTGIVPADITRNVWALGEVAPTLVARLNSLTQKMPAGNYGNTTYEEGQYFDNFTMNVYPTKDYDMDKLLMEARAKVRLTKHNN